MRPARVGQPSIPPAVRCVSTGWGRATPSATDIVRPASLEECYDLLSDPPTRGIIVRGAGRSYGDAAQNAGGVTLLLDSLARRLQLDTARKTVEVGAAVSLAELLEHLIPRGLFLPVLPGTAHITVGGAIAADIHGKNHHRDSSLGAHVLSLRVIGASGMLEAERDSGAPVFDAVIGGMGLAAMIVDARIRLEAIDSAWMAVDTEKTTGLDETMAALESLDAKKRYSVAWIDTSIGGKYLGRGVVQGADHADRRWVADAGRSASRMPVLGRRLRILEFGSAPQGYPDDWEGITYPADEGSLVSAATSLFEEAFLAIRPARPASIALFNRLWYKKAPRSRSDELQPLNRFFFPLDAIGGWNRVYGKSGFVQYQFVVPYGREDVISRALTELRSIGAYSPVTVLKRMGAGSGFPLSFPIPGWTLALDIPVVIEGLNRILNRLDEAVAEAGGRVYLAKDSRMRKELVSPMYKRIDEWREARAKLDPEGIFESDMSRRLSLKERPG